MNFLVSRAAPTAAHSILMVNIEEAVVHKDCDGAIIEAGRGNVVNLKVARRLDEVAQILSEQGANPYRVQAYRNAAANLRRLLRSVDDILKESGEPGLRKIPSIGPSLARAIATLVLTGRLPMLNRLRGESEHEALLASPLRLASGTN